MKTQKHVLFIIASFLAIGFITGCKKESTDNWVETKNVEIIADKAPPENGKQYLEVIYENIGKESYRKIKYQLITKTGMKTDTIEKVIMPATVFEPKEKHLVPRAIGEEPVTFDEVKVGKVWVVKDEK